MNSRRTLLEELFHRLNERQLPHCVQRNYGDLFDDTTSDVDLLTLPERLAEFMAVCEAAATATRHRLVQKTRFVNHSLVFWDGADGFVRIDVDTEKRWRRHHLLTAGKILHKRRRLTAFDVPDPCHEFVILLTQALWQGKLSDRYAARLRELDSEISDKDSLADLLGAVFGLRENVMAKLDDPALIKRLASAVRRRSFCQPERAWRTARYFRDDLARLLVRLKSPPGVTLRSIGLSDADLKELSDALTVLFPIKKGLSCAGPVQKSALRKTLFKGGMAIESWPALNWPAPVIRQSWPAPNRGFALHREPDGTVHFMHAGSGAMQSSPGAAKPGGPPHFISELAPFICSTLADQLAPQPPARKGSFVVLVGLDGSGKTTLARNLATLVTKERLFAGVRYLHWLPSPRQRIEFPLPETGNRPPRAARAAGIFAALLSAARLVKNLVRTRLAFCLWLRPALRRGHLVLVDRYFYNYHLDPASVKFSAPNGLLAFAQKFFPPPDAVIKLSAPPAILLQRKQELSEAEILRQADTLETLEFKPARVIAADARRPAEELARTALAEILKAAP